MIKPPLFVIEGLDISAYASVEALEMQLEAIDVKDNIYTVYDSEGRLLKLGITIEERPILFGLFKVKVERVIIESVELGHQNELSEHLINFLSYFISGNREKFQSMSLERLIQIFVNLCGIVR